MGEQVRPPLLQALRYSGGSYYLCHFIKVEFYHRILTDDFLSGKESACIYTVPYITRPSSIDTYLGTKQTLAGDSGFQVLAIPSDFYFMPSRMTYSGCLWFLMEGP